MLATVFVMLMSCPYILLRTEKLTGSFPKPLPPDKEREYILKCAAGDENARNILVEHNLRLVAHIIKKYYTQTGDQDDLISIGTIGLIKGVSTYRPDKGVRLATYASRCIENEILMYFRSARKFAGEVSLSDPVDTDKEGNTLSLMDMIFSGDDMLENISTKELTGQLGKFIETKLTERERSIISLRYGIGEQQPLTQREIAKKCNISRSYVSRIEKKALEKLKECFEAAAES